MGKAELWKRGGQISTLVALGGIVSGLWHVYVKFPLYSKIALWVGLAGLVIIGFHYRKHIVEWAKRGGDGGTLVVAAPTNLVASGGGQITSEGSVMIAGGDRMPAMYPTTRSYDQSPTTVTKLTRLQTKLLALSAELMPLNSSATGDERVKQYNEQFASKVFAAYVEARDRGYWDDFLELHLIGPNPGAWVFVIAQRLGALGYLINPQEQGAPDED